jgi:predicted nucleotidyltransferase
MAMKVDLKKEQIQELCKKFNVKELYIFGSATTDDFSEDSDLDFIVKFDRQGFEGAFNQFIDFKHELEQMYGRSVDLYHHKKFRNSIFQQEVERSKKLLYAA